MDQKYLVLDAKCCRIWPVDPLTRIGRCGYCGEVPKIIPGQMDKLDEN